MSHTQRVFVDANVLFSRTLRDWLFLLRIETDSSFQVHSTEDVLNETLYKLRRKNSAWSGGQISRLRKKLEENIDEIVLDYTMDIPYNGSDPNDRHVHAAAAASHADILLTADKTFAQMAQDDSLPYSVYGCDDFFVLIDDSGARAVQRVVDEQREYYTEKSKAGQPVKTLSEALIASGCDVFAQRVDRHLRTLSGPTQETHPRGIH